MTSIWRWFGSHSQNGKGELERVVAQRACRVALLWYWAVGALLSWPLGASAAPEWKMLETPRFTVISQLDEKETCAWADEFNQFIEALKGLFKLNEAFLPRLTVVLFKRDKDFGVYRPVGGDGKVQDWVAGYFARQETWSVIGMADRWDDNQTRRTIFHEGVHWVVSADQRHYPLWFSEGIAELYSTFSAQKATVTWGEAIESHVSFLNHKKLLSIKELLGVSASDPRFNETDRTGLFYAQSWAFVHYLVFGQRKDNRGTLGGFLTAYYSGISTEDAFRNTFGMDFAAMDSALDTYLSGGKFRIYKFPSSPNVKSTAPFQTAPPALVQVALAKLAYGTQRKELATKHANEAVRLDPTCADGYKMLAWVRHFEESPDGFLEAAEKAVQLGAKDADAFWLLAMAKYTKAKSQGGVPASEARQIANLLEKSINLLPSSKSAFVNLANVLPDVAQPTDQDTEFLDFGCKQYPDEPMLVVGQARLLRKKGAHEEAAKILQGVLAAPGMLSVEQQKYLIKLKASWDYTDTMEEARKLTEQKKHKEIVALMDGFLARGPTIEMKDPIMKKRWSALASATLQEAREAQKNGQLEEAARCYESIVAMQRAPTHIRGQARQALEKLEASKSDAAAQ